MFTNNFFILVNRYIYRLCKHNIKDLSLFKIDVITFFKQVYDRVSDKVKCAAYNTADCSYRHTYILHIVSGAFAPIYRCFYDFFRV